MEPEKSEQSFKEKRIRALTNLYYSNQEIQKAIFNFCKNREISPRYFEGFGKRPDSFEYPGDVFALAGRGATSFHCSEEIWEDPMKISVDMGEQDYNQIRIGWDLLIDIDCPWIEYSKLAAKALIQVFNEHKIKGVGIKFSGSKGFHLLVPWKAFPKSIGEEQAKNLFPEVPRKLVAFLRSKARPVLESLLPEEDKKRIRKSGKIKQGIKCNICGEIAREYEFADLFCTKCQMGEQRKIPKGSEEKLECPNCRSLYDKIQRQPIFVCEKCDLDSKTNSSNFSLGRIESDIFEVLGLDIILVSPRHLFRTPYSLHEKTALASVVLDLEELDNFDLKHADPLKVKIKNFMPENAEEEAKEFVMQALDWAKENKIGEERKEKVTGKYADFKPLELQNITEEQFPPCVKNILNGIGDGRKRALFVLINLFRSIGMDKKEMEKKIHDWNEKNEVPLKLGYIKSQLQWTYRRKPIMPQNCKEFYQAIGVCQPDSVCTKIKNPVNYVVRKNFVKNRNNSSKNSNKFKNNN
jgi:hypothetical protein